MFFNKALEAGLLTNFAKGDYDQGWRDVGFILKNTFDDEKGWKLFDKFSRLDDPKPEGKYDEAINREYWDKWKSSEGKKLTMGRLDKMLKEIDTAAVAEVRQAARKSHKQKAIHNENGRFVDSNNAAALILMEELRDVLIPAKDGRLFYKKGKIWVCDKVNVDKHILNYIMDSKIYKYNEELKPIPYVENIVDAKHVREALFTKIETQSDVVDIYSKFHTTTKHRLCFKDGVLDFKTKKFYVWSEVEFEFYSTVMIDLEFADYVKSPDLKLVADIKAKVYDNVFGKKSVRALNFLARAIAGHFEDKNFATYLGNRNCGKGVLYDNISHAFGKYVMSFELGNILIQRNTDTQEVSRKLYWLLDYEFIRLGISQETPSKPENGAGLKVNAKLFKKMTSGGDDQVARRNYDKVDTHFKIDTTWMMMGNDELNFDAADCKEHQIEFQSVNQYKSQKVIDKMVAKGEKMKTEKEKKVNDLLIASYKVQDTIIKDMCASEEWKKATIYLLFQHYVESSLVSDVDFQKSDEEEKSLRASLLEKFEITCDYENDIIAVDSIKEYEIKGDKKKIQNELISMGVTKKKHNKKGELKDKWCYYGLKEREEEEEQEEDDDEEEEFTTDEDEEV
jgi:hypothetical protein